MKKAALVLIILFSINQGQAQNIDSLNIENKNSEKALQNEIISNYEALNDSLKEELRTYKVKEDYFAAALSDQSTRFALIISLVFFSFSGFIYSGTWVLAGEL